jgi:hypothetical protein
VYFGLEQDESGRNLMPQPLLWPTVSVTRYLAPGPIARSMQRHPGRYDTWDQPEVQIDKGYLFDQTPPTWPALENTRGMLFGIPDSMGYSPLQLTRYWSWIHAVNGTPVFYNAAVLHDPTAQDLRMLGVRYLIVRTSDPPPVPGKRVTSEGRYTLYEIPGNSRASLVNRWSVVPDGPQALRAVTLPGFDPRSRAVLVRDPGIDQDPGATGSVTYRRVSPQETELHTNTTGPELLVVHDSFDHGWTYSVDGAPPVQVLAADYFLQGVPVPGGRHTVVLRYSDPRIGQGLLASAMAWVLLLVAMVGPIIVRRARKTQAPADV